MDFKYNYIILSSNWDLYTLVFKDISSLENITYIDSPAKNQFISKLFYFFLNPRLNSSIKIPFRRYLNSLILRKIKYNHLPLCFIIYHGWYTLDNHIIEDIRKRFPQAKIVIYFTDLIKIQKMRFSQSPIDIEYLKSISDLVLTYDINEAKDFDITHYDVPLSIEDSPQSDGSSEYDVYFIGQAKDRLPVILGVYYKLIEAKLKVNFILSNVRKELQEDLPGITYVDGFKLPYNENIRNVKNSRCILEIVQGESTGQTFRTKEAIAYDKKLLTNNTYIKEAPFYNPEFISVFENPSDINPDFIRDLKSDEKVDYQYKDNLSPIKLLEFIEEKLK